MAVFETKPVESEEKKEDAKKKPMLKKHRDVWWEGNVYPHPMTDAQFVEAFCAHVFLTTADRSIATVRNRGYRFIRNFMSPELEDALTKYREDYP